MPPTPGSAILSGTEFPDIELTSTNSSLNVAKSATLTGSTPFGEYFGSSRGQQYLTSGVASGKPEGSVTLTFASSPIPGTWGFVLGDVDAEDIKVSAKDAKGAPVDVRGWQFEPFNYAGEADLPQWTLETERILGNGVDTAGASMWVTPTTPVASITLTQVKLSGFPQYQLWIAADVLTATDVQVAPVADSICTRVDTNLINGDFEFPVLPVKSSSQITQRDVPGWDTTATDGKIEIWSSGFKDVVAAEANQFAEINATQPSELFQVVNTIPGETLTWSLMHRARGAGAVGDTMSVNIGAVGEKANAIYTFTDALPAGWVRHTGDYTVPEGQVKTRFGFESGATASGSKSIGNFLDDIYFTTTECIPASVTDVTPTVPDVSPSPSGSASPSASPTVEPTVTPTASATESAKPDRPTRIAIEDLPGVEPGSVITDVTPVENGKVLISGGDIVFTPEAGFRGIQEITLVVTNPSGVSTEVSVSVKVGKDQVIITNWNAPKRLAPGLTWFGPGTFMTNAGQIAKVGVDCSIIRKWNSPNPSPICEVLAGKEGTYISLKLYEPTLVEVTLTAPKKGKYAPLEETFTYRVNP